MMQLGVKCVFLVRGYLSERHRCSDATRQARGNPVQSTTEVQNLKPGRFSFNAVLGMEISISEVVKMRKEILRPCDGCLIFLRICGERRHGETKRACNSPRLQAR